MSRHEASFGFYIAVLSFIGAVFGTYIGSILEQSNWEKRYYVEASATLLEHRISLIERITNLINKRPLVEALKARIRAEVSSGMTSSACVTRPSDKDQSGCVDARSADAGAGQNAVEEILTLNADFTAAMSLAIIYFGPLTRQAVIELNKDGPWNSDDNQRQALLDSLGTELNLLPSGMAKRAR